MDRERWSFIFFLIVFFGSWLFFILAVSGSTPLTPWETVQNPVQFP